MWLRDLPPTGNPISLHTNKAKLPSFEGYRAVYVNSGTAALALALKLARVRQPQINNPEVILPGYACPDLVAAAEFAGVRPVLADIHADDPGYNIDSLQQVLSAQTVAVVAINFLGIRERLSLLRESLRSHPQILLIEDNAQWFPERVAAGPDDLPLSSDAICFSFGRGKPVSLLGGGLFLASDSLLSELEKTSANNHTDIFRLDQGEAGRLPFVAKTLAYNLLLHPALYGLINRNPLLHLGQTVFKPLSGIQYLDDYRRALLPANLDKYWARVTSSKDNLLPQQYLLAQVPAAMNLPAQLESRTGRLLRFPIIFPDVESRDAALSELVKKGLGATALYRRYLPEVEGVAGRLDLKVALPGAVEFAGRLLTLPTHSGVKPADLDSILSILKKFSN